jgi:hypothetical protein
MEILRRIENGSNEPNAYATGETMCKLMLAIAVAAVVLPFSAVPDNEEFYGTYELINGSVKYLDTGEVVRDVYGKYPKGFVMYGRDSRMLLVITNDGRPKPESTARMTDQQRIDLFRTMQAYGGTYTFDGHTIEHHVDICWDEVRCGTTVIRDVQKDGDRMIYTTRPAPFSENGRMSIATLVWQKVK